MVRVALVGVKPGDTPPNPRESFPKTTDRSRLRRPEELAGPGQPLEGEVWIEGRAGGPRVWRLLPAGCLAVERVERSSVTFAVRPGCPPRPRRLLSLVYDRRRSPAVARRARPAALPAEIRRGKTLLGDTLSLFVRPVWSPEKRSRR